MVEFQKSDYKKQMLDFARKKMPRLSGFAKTCPNVGIVSC